MEETSVDYDDEPPPPPPPQSQASSHFPLEPISGSTLFDVEVARREHMHRHGTLSTGCGEMDRQVLGGHGFERGSVVGISAEHMDTGLLIGLQTIAHSLLATRLELGTGHAQEPPLLRAAVITTLPAPSILPHLRDVIRVQAKLKLGPSQPDVVVDTTTRQCLERISISRVFDMEGLWEVLSELESAAVEDERPVEPKISKEEELDAPRPVPDPDVDLPESPQRPPPLSPVTKLPPLRMRTEVQDSEEEDNLLSSSPLSSLPSSPSAPSEYAAEPIAPSPRAALSRQPSPSPLRPQQQEPEVSGLPDIILITHISALFSTLFTARDKTSAHTTLQLLSSHLRYLSRSAGPLILLLNSTSSSTAPSTNQAQPPPTYGPSRQAEPASRPLDPTLRSIFNPPPPSHLGYAATTTHALSRKNKPAFGPIFTQFLDLHLLCTKVPRSREDAETLFSSTTPSMSGRQQQRAVQYAWVVEVLVDELGTWEWEDDAAASAATTTTTTNTTADDKNSKKGKTVDKKKWKTIDREQRWGAIEVRNAGCQIVDAFDTTRSARLNIEPIRHAAGFGGRRV